MECTGEGCRKRWNPEEIFPLCITTPCPLRAYKGVLEASKSSVLKKTTIVSRERSLGAAAAAAVASIDKIREATDEKEFISYKMNGDEAATTTVILPTQQPMAFKTKHSMHSEMCALDYMLENNHWVLRYGRVIKSSGGPFTKGEFVTGQPHCGFCTIMLSTLGLPITLPTSGNHKKGGDGSYPVPRKIKNSPEVIVKLLNNGFYAHHLLKKALNPYVNVKPEEWLLKINDFIIVSDAGPVYIDSVTEDIYTNFSIFVADEILKDSNIIDDIWMFINNSIFSSNKACHYGSR